MMKNLKVALFVLIIIILVMLVFYYLPQSKTAPSTPSDSLITTDAQRFEVLKEVSNVPPANPKMTDEQRLKLMSQPATIIKK
jgi:hypothetical protein